MTNPEPKLSALRRNWKLLLASTVITMFLGFVAAEVIVRLRYPYRTPDTLREKSLEFESTLFSRHAFPQWSQTSQDTSRGSFATINDRGYRGPSFAVPKPEEVTRLVVLGGSGAFDVYAAEGRDWPSLVEAELHRQGFADVEVINAAVPGHATWDSLGRFYSEIWMFEPDFVLIYHAWNDIKYFTWLGPEQSLLRGYRPHDIATGYSDRLVGNPFMYYSGPLDRFLSNSQFYVRVRWAYLSMKLGEASLEGIVGNESPVAASDSFADEPGKWGPEQFRLNLQLIVDAASAVDAIPILATQARLVDSSNSSSDRDRISYDRVQLSHEGLVTAFGLTDQILVDVSEANDAPLLDLSPLNGRSELFVDQIHTTAGGSEAIAQLAAELLTHVLEQKE